MHKFIVVYKFIVAKTEIRTQNHKKGPELMVGVSAGQKKEWLILKDSGKASSKKCFDWMVRRWIEAHEVSG